MVDLWNPSPKPSIFPIFGSINGNHQWKPSIFTIFTGNHQWIMGAFRDPDFPLLQPIRWRIKKSPGAVRKSSVDMDVSHRPTHWGYHLSNKYLSDSDLRNSKNRTWRPTQPVENCSFTGKWRKMIRNHGIQGQEFWGNPPIIPEDSLESNNAPPTFCNTSERKTI